MPSTAQLSAMRARSEKTLTDSCTIKRPGAATSNGMGGQSETESTLGPYKCRVTPPSTQGQETMLGLGANNVTGDRAIALSRWKVRLPYGTDVTEKDRIIVGSLALEVVAVSGGHTDEVTRVAQCVKVS